MRTVRRSAAFVAAAAVAGAAALTSAAPASAASGWTISPGGSFTATAKPWSVSDPSTGSSISCASLALHGQLTPGTVPGPVIGSFGSATATSCTGPLGSAFTVTFSGFPWSISATGYTSGSDTVTGTVSGVRGHLSGLGCTADLVGAGSGAGVTLDHTYANPSHRLTLSGGNGHLANVSGTCLGLLNNGDAATLGGSFDVEPPQVVRPA